MSRCGVSRMARLSYIHKIADLGSTEWAKTIVRRACLCGSVRYQCEGNLGPAHYCHCEDCRRCTGSINIAVQVEARSFRIIAGSPRGFTKQADSGNSLTRYFCPECGSPLYTVSPVHPDVLYVKAGTLDDPRLVQPRRQNWMQSRVSWTTIDPALPSSPKNPEART